MSRESWLEHESANWQADGLISPETRQAILARYPVQPADPSRTLIPLAVLTAGVGLVLLAAWNWARLSDAVKVGFTATLTMGLYAAAWRAARRASAWREAWWLAAPLGAWTLLTTVSEVRGWHDDKTLAFWCAVVAAVTAASNGGVLVAVLGAAAPAWWLLQDGGGHMQWAFPLVFAVAAVGVERACHRAPAIVAAVSFSVWAAMLVGSTYAVSELMPLATLLAGAALVQWSRQADTSRPAFARQTPGRAVMVIGLGMLLLVTLHPSDADAGAGVLWRVRAGYRAWEALALVGGLIVIGTGLWPRAARVAAEGRWAGALALAWFAAASASQLTRVGAWVWVTLASGLLLGCGAAWVREASATRDRGTFALGILSVVVLTGAHFTVNPGGGTAWRGAAVLLMSAAALALTAMRRSGAKSPR